MSRAAMRCRLCAFLCLAISPQAHAHQDDLAGQAERAKQAMLSQRYAEAAEIYQRLVTELPGEPGLRFNLALALHSMGQYPESKRILESIRTPEAGNPRFWFLLGEDYLNLEQPGKAVEMFQRAARLAPSDLDTSLELASALLESGQFAAASNRFEQLAAQHPDLPKAWAGLSLSQSRLSEHEQAKESMRKLASLPESVEQHEMLARLHVQAQQPAEAIRELRAAEKLSPGNTRVESALARALIANRQFDEAITLLTGKLPENSRNSGQLFNLGDALLQTGRIDEAIPQLKRAVELSPWLLPAQAKLGEALMQAGSPAEAVNHLKLATPIDKDGSIYFQLATAYRRLGKTEYADQAMARRAEIQKDSRTASHQ